jgi:hypothetical protein
MANLSSILGSTGIGGANVCGGGMDCGLGGHGLLSRYVGAGVCWVALVARISLVSASPRVTKKTFEACW